MVNYVGIQYTLCMDKKNMGILIKKCGFMVYISYNYREIYTNFKLFRYYLTYI